MGRSRGLSDTEKQELLARIERLLGDTPKGRLARQLVEELSGAESASDTERPHESG